jgi:putative ABC transport system permease protein
MKMFRENLMSGLRALRENGVRSALTVLGITIGVGSVVLLLAIGIGVKQDVTRQVDSLGANVMFVVPGKLDKSGQPNPMSTLGISTLTESDVAALGRVPGITLSLPVSFVFGTVDRGKTSTSALVFGAPPAISQWRPTPMLEGRFFTEAERAARLCVLSYDQKEELFGSGPAVGQTVTVRDVPFKVIGVTRKEEDSLFGQFSFANIAYVPYQAVREAYPGGGQINRIFLKIDYRSRPAALKEAVERTLRTSHGGKEDFGVLTPLQLQSAVNKLFNIVSSLVIGIGAVSLVVAGIGIMNIMLVTVTERTREIGVRKTVGARRADIFAQFLVEAVLMCLLGGVAGTALAWAICIAVARYTPLKATVTPGVVALAFGVCLLVGLVFGVAPAMRAARQDPIQALRWE